MIIQDSLKPDVTPLCFIERFTKIAFEYPHLSAIALSNNDTLTYGQMNLLATKIALLIASKGFIAIPLIHVYYCNAASIVILTIIIHDLFKI